MFPLSRQVYDLLKRVVTVILPALATLILGFGTLWNWSPAANVAGSIVLLTTFLGVCLNISSSQFQKTEVLDGDLHIAPDVDGGRPTLYTALEKSPEGLKDGDRVTFRVKRQKKLA